MEIYRLARSCNAKIVNTTVHHENVRKLNTQQAKFLLEKLSFENIKLDKIDNLIFGRHISFKSKNCQFHETTMFNNDTDDINKDSFIKFKFPNIHDDMHNTIHDTLYNTTYDSMHIKLPSFLSLLSCIEKLVFPCPELLLYQLCGTINDLESKMITLEFFGTYTKTTGEKNSNFMSNVNPLSTKKASLAYARKHETSLNKHPGFHRYKSCIDMASQNSASPAESKIFMLLCDAKHFGCYGLPLFDMNKTIHLSREAKLIAGQSIVKPDFSLIKHKIALEYDSKQFHENFKQDQKDKQRRDALTHDGWHVITITPAQYNNINSFRQIVKDIYKLMGKRYRVRIKDFSIRERNTREKLRHM